MAQEYQHTEKSRRARLHNNALSKMEKAALQNEEAESPTHQAGEDSAAKSKSIKKKLVKPGLTKKLAHRWHGSFRIKKKVEEFAFELELSNKSGYQFYPVAHISRLKPVNKFSSRPDSTCT
ncbi:hypothetical protein PHMEG_00010465 [Phytophthora megakarya]|uniref:Tf2-1-like SH3-like domain-containing protein n=1 Tax=Phytophthora megakarya TaxID=4795 RepID=A0A225WEY9_9STRA|nr:hypothetical protein PHMEG_00010465 [Phytophthora megakarya]